MTRRAADESAAQNMEDKAAPEACSPPRKRRKLHAEDAKDIPLQFQQVQDALDVLEKKFEARMVEFEDELDRARQRYRHISQDLDEMFRMEQARLCRLIELRCKEAGLISEDESEGTLDDADSKSNSSYAGSIEV